MYEAYRAGNSLSGFSCKRAKERFALLFSAYKRKSRVKRMNLKFLLQCSLLQRVNRFFALRSFALRSFALCSFALCSFALRSLAFLKREMGAIHSLLKERQEQFTPIALFVKNNKSERVKSERANEHIPNPAFN